MRNVAAICFVVALFSILASAQIPTAGNVFFGYSYYNTDLSSTGRANLNGWQGSLEGKIFPLVGIVADITGDYGSQSFATTAGTCAIGVSCSPVTITTHVYEALFGPRVSVSVGKFRPFAELEVGVGHVSTSGFVGSDTSLATAVGGGLDYRIIRPLAWRLAGDYVHTSFFSNHQNNVRLSTGIVFRF